MKTKAQLEAWNYPKIGIQLLDGGKLFGRALKFTQHNIYFRDNEGKKVSIPRRLVERALLLIEGGTDNVRAEAVSTADKP